MGLIQHHSTKWATALYRCEMVLHGNRVASPCSLQVEVSPSFRAALVSLVQGMQIGLNKKWKTMEENIYRIFIKMQNFIFKCKPYSDYTINQIHR